MESRDEDLKLNIIRKLNEFDIRGRKEYHDKFSSLFSIAAVLLPLKLCNGEVYILLTKRAKFLRSHASEASFPGGKVDDCDDSIITTALREANEEIGLPPSSVEVLAVLSKGITIHRNIIYPVVGLIPNDFEPSINESEVEFAFFMPLKDFLCEERVEISLIPLGFGNFVNRAVTYNNGDQEVIVWGFTSTFCTFLAIILLDKGGYFELFDGCKNNGRADDCVAQYFNALYNWVMASNTSKL